MDSDIGKIFVGGISWETSEEMLKSYFESYGDVADCVIMKDRATGRARGFGFVSFADPAVVDKVLLEQHTIGDRVVEVKKAVPREEQQNFPRSNNAVQVSGGLNRTRKIFVGGLASTVTEEDFRNYFAQFGSITDVVVMYDHNTQRPRGFGFITFDSEDSVEKVVQKSFHQLQDKMVEVKKAIPKELSAGPGSRSGGGSFGQGFGAGHGAPYNAGYGQGNSLNPSNAYGGPRYAPPSGGGRSAFPPYGPAGYGTPGYEANPGYGVAMNGGYGAPGYGSAYGTSAPSVGYGGGAGFGVTGPPSGGFVNAPAGPRNPWGNVSTGFTAAGGSPAVYAAGGQATMSGYGTPGWTTGSVMNEANNGTGGFSNGVYSYGASDGAYSNNAGGYPTRNTASATGSYGDGYAPLAAYGDSTWRTGESHSSPAATGSTGYGVGSGGVGMGATPIDASGYGVSERQSARVPDTRFRPYPASGDRST